MDSCREEDGGSVARRVGLEEGGKVYLELDGDMMRYARRGAWERVW